MPHPVYLVRHGQSEWNVRRLTQGQTVHPALTDLGRAQAAAAAETIASDLQGLGLPAGRLLTSDLIRAVQSAEIIGTRLGVEVELDPRLREQHLGELQGLAYEESWARAESFDWSDPTWPVPGGESALDVQRRMAAVLADVAPVKDGGDGVVTILISHGDAIRAAAAHLAGRPPHQAPWVEVANGAVARVADGLSWLS